MIAADGIYIYIHVYIDTHATHCNTKKNIAARDAGSCCVWEGMRAWVDKIIYMYIIYIHIYMYIYILYTYTYICINTYKHEQQYIYIWIYVLIHTHLNNNISCIFYSGMNPFFCQYNNTRNMFWPKNTTTHHTSFDQAQMWISSSCATLQHPFFRLHGQFF